MKDIINETVPHCDILEANRKKGKMIKIKINHKKVEQLKSFYGVKLKGNETFNELLAIEKKNMMKGGRTMYSAGGDASVMPKATPN